MMNIGIGRIFSIVRPLSKWIGNRSFLVMCSDDAVAHILIINIVQDEVAAFITETTYLHRMTNQEKFTKSIEELELIYEDEKNSMIAVTESVDIPYEDFYDERDNRMKVEHSMDMLFFGPPSSFLRLDTETLLHILINTKKHSIPIARAILAWDMVTDGKTAAYLQGRELIAFGRLLDVVPEEDLYNINFGNPSVLKYFTNYFNKISNRKFGILIAAFRRYYGDDWFKTGTNVNELGYLLCGFPYYELEKISPTTFRELNTEVLGKLQRCNADQIQTLYNVATHSDAYGEPYKWTSHEISRLNMLFNCIPGDKISSIQLEAITAITPAVIKRIDQNKLQYFTQQQILRMNSKTRRIYILRMQLKKSLDTIQITKKFGEKNKPYSVFILSIIFAVHFML